MVIGETCYTLSRTKYCSDLLLRSFLLRIVSFLPRLTLYRLKCKQSETIDSFVHEKINRINFSRKICCYDLMKINIFHNFFKVIIKLKICQKNEKWIYPSLATRLRERSGCTVIE